jgi:hypothetical protein
MVHGPYGMSRQFSSAWSCPAPAAEDLSAGAIRNQHVSVVAGTVDTQHSLGENRHKLLRDDMTANGAQEGSGQTNDAWGLVSACNVNLGSVVPGRRRLDQVVMWFPLQRTRVSLAEGISSDPKTYEFPCTILRLP